MLPSPNVPFPASPAARAKTPAVPNTAPHGQQVEDEPEKEEQVGQSYFWPLFT